MKIKLSIALGLMITVVALSLVVLEGSEPGGHQGTLAPSQQGGADNAQDRAVSSNEPGAAAPNVLPENAGGLRVAPPTPTATAARLRRWELLNTEERAAHLMQLDMQPGESMQDAFRRLVRNADAGSPAAMLDVANVLQKCQAFFGPASPDAPSTLEWRRQGEFCQGLGHQDRASMHAMMTEYLDRAAATGLPEAIVAQTGVLPYFVAYGNDPAKSRAWVERVIGRITGLAASGNFDGMEQLASMKTTGWIVERDLAGAEALYLDFLHRAPRDHPRYGFAQARYDALQRKKLADARQATATGG